MRIASKVFLGHGLTLGLLTVVGVVSLLLMSGDRDRFYAEVDHLTSMRKVTSEIRRELHAGRWQVESFIRKPSTQKVELVQTSFNSVRKNLEALQTFHFSPEQFLQFEQFIETFEDYKINFSALNRFVHSRGFDEDTGYRGAFRQAAHDLEEQLFVNDSSGLIHHQEMLGHHISDLMILVKVPEVRKVYLSEIDRLLPQFITTVQESSLHPAYKDEILKGVKSLQRWRSEYDPDTSDTDNFDDLFRLYRDLEILIQSRNFGDLRESYFNIRRREKDYLLRGDQKYINMVKSMLLETDSRLSAFSQNFSSADILRKQLGAYRKNFELLTEVDLQIDDAIVMLSSLSEDLSRQVQELESFVEIKATSDAAGLVEAGNRMGIRLFLFGALTLISAIWFAFRFSQGISRPLEQATGMLKSLEDGDFGPRLNLQRNDEIGVMAKALDGFAETLEAAMTAVVCAISDRDQARLTLDRELAQKNAILAGFDGYIYVCTDDMRIEFMNQKLIDRTGRDATGEYCYTALHDKKEVCEWCPNIDLKPDTPYHWEIQSPKDNRWYSIINNLISYPDNQLRKLSMISDITEHKEALKSLQLSEERYRQLFDKTPLPMWVVDMESLGYLDVNQAAIEKYGYTREEFLTMTIMDIRPPEEIPRLEEGLVRANNGQEEVGLWRHRCKDGRLLDVIITLKDTSYEGKSVRLVMAHDVTEAEVLRRELDQSARLAAIGELAAGVAHEINNPNGMLLMNLGLMSDVHKDLEPILENLYRDDPDLELGKLPYPVYRSKIPYLLNEMTAGGQRIKRIVEDLKGFARLENIDDMALMDINEFSAAAVRLVSYQIEKATSNFSTSYADRLPEVRGNYNRLEQVVVNLLINATQALENREQSISLATGFSEDCKSLVIKVTDSGKGIAAEHLDKIFDPFYTTRRNDGGTGLGLSLSRRIVEEHGGSLRISSTPGFGTEIQLLLPRLPEDSV